MPAISVIVPVYNTEKYLDRCVKSIINQTFSDFELILVDDGSPDYSGILCDKWSKKDSRIKVIHQQNAGAGAARNAGIKNATGRYIGFVDSDNWIELNMYQTLYDAITKYKTEVAMVRMKTCKNYVEPLKRTENKYNITVKDRDEMLARFFRIHGEDSSIIDVGPKLIDKRILDNFNFVEGTICEDVYASFEFIIRSERTAVIGAELYDYFYNPMGVTRGKVSIKDFEYIDAYKRILDIVNEEYPQFVPFAEMSWIRSYFTVLSKMKLFGYDKNDRELKKKYHELKNFVRNHFMQLLTYDMPITRKILLVIVCI